MPEYGFFSDPYFPVKGQNHGKIQAREKSYFGIFYGVVDSSNFQTKFSKYHLQHT